MHLCWREATGRLLELHQSDDLCPRYSALHGCVEKSIVVHGKLNVLAVESGTLAMLFTQNRGGDALDLCDEREPIPFHLSNWVLLVKDVYDLFGLALWETIAYAFHVCARFLSLPK